MRQDTPTQSQTICGDWSHGLSGFKLTHTVRLVSRSNPGVVSTAAAVLESEAVAVDGWAVTRCGDIFEQRIVLGEMTETQAVRLREQLAALDGVLRTRMEHHFVRTKTATSEGASQGGRHS
jgi:hypothetical protein